MENFEEILGREKAKFMSKERIDRLICDRGLAPSRARAQALFTTQGVSVFSGDKRITKPGTLVDDSLPVRIDGEEMKFVSRGGLKLEGALVHFNICVEGMDALDVGASTGGFTDCLLQRGAKSVVALDVGSDQLASKIRSDGRVIVREKVNARCLKNDDVPYLVDFIVADVSFISLKLVLPSAMRFLKRGGAILVLVKPQFEVGREGVGKNGVVKNSAIRMAAIQGIVDFVARMGMRVIGWVDSSIPGPEGNVEALLYARWPENLVALNLEP